MPESGDGDHASQPRGDPGQPASRGGEVRAADTIWPVIGWAAPLTDANGAFVCGRHAVNAGDGVVETGYTERGAPAAFEHCFGPGACAGCADCGNE